jgi:hypothetical protein
MAAPCQTAPVDHRAVARMIAAGRVVVGVALLAAPGLVAGNWAGEVGAEPGAKLLARAVGARDLVLGLGVLAALERGDPQAAAWVRAAAVADAGDAAATFLAYRHLPRVKRFGVLVLAAGSAGTGFVAADNLG